MNTHRILAKYAPLLLVGVALGTLTGCPPEAAEQRAPQVCMGDWRLFITESTGIQYFMYIRIRPDGSAQYLPTEHTGDYPVYWELVGDMFHIQDQLPEGRSFIATIESTCFYSGVVYENADPNTLYGTFTAEFLPSLVANELPDPVLDP